MDSDNIEKLISEFKNKLINDNGGIFSFVCDKLYGNIKSGIINLFEQDQKESITYCKQLVDFCNSNTDKPDGGWYFIKIMQLYLLSLAAAGDYAGVISELGNPNYFHPLCDYKQLSQFVWIRELCDGAINQNKEKAEQAFIKLYNLNRFSYGFIDLLNKINSEF